MLGVCALTGILKAENLHFEDGARECALTGFVDRDDLCAVLEAVEVV